MAIGLVTRALDPNTWSAFEDLAARNNGVWNGCYCTWFHPHVKERGVTAQGNRDYKHRLVAAGKAHAALVFDGAKAVGWCEFGTPEELPSMKHHKEYLDGVDTLPDYRITCFYVESGYRRQGVSEIALGGALELIAAAGGGVVEAYPHDLQGKKVSASFLYNGTRTLFEQAGFSYLRSKGKTNCVMSRTVVPTKRRGIGPG